MGSIFPTFRAEHYEYNTTSVVFGKKMVETVSDLFFRVQYYGHRKNW
jgi:hypothetical protein